MFDVFVGSKDVFGFMIRLLMIGKIRFCFRRLIKIMNSKVNLVRVDIVVFLFGESLWDWVVFSNIKVVKLVGMLFVG